MMQIAYRMPHHDDGIIAENHDIGLDEFPEERVANFPQRQRGGEFILPEDDDEDECQDDAITLMKKGTLQRRADGQRSCSTINDECLLVLRGPGMTKRTRGMADILADAHQIDDDDDESDTDEADDASFRRRQYAVLTTSLVEESCATIAEDDGDSDSCHYRPNHCLKRMQRSSHTLTEDDDLFDSLTCNSSSDGEEDDHDDGDDWKASRGSSLRSACFDASVWDETSSFQL